MRRLLCTLTLAGLATFGCHGQEPAEQAPAVSSDAAPATDEAVDSRDQYALAEAIVEARSVRADLEGTLARTRAAWIGERYRWEVAFVPMLCGKVGACVVMPFDHNRDPDHPIRQGWLPRLDLSPQERVELADACKDHERCVIELSGDLKQFELSTEQPTSLTLSDIEVHGTRAAADTESWVRGMRRPVAHRQERPNRAEAAEQMKAAVASGLG